MKTILLLAALLVSSTVFAADSDPASESVITMIKGCVSIHSKISVCTTKFIQEPVVYLVSVETKDGKIEVASDREYEGVDTTRLFLGLEKVSTNGFNMNQMAKIAGPVARDISLISKGELTQEEVTTGFAKYLAVKKID